jgi:hypothetical protein
VRAKVVVAICVIAALVLFVLARLKHQSRPASSSHETDAENQPVTKVRVAAQPSQSGAIGNDVSAATNIETIASVTVPNPETAAAPAVAPNPTTHTSDPVAVKKRISQLIRLGREDDAKSYESIVGDLTNSTPAIRAAARDAAMQFGNRDAIPLLKNAAEVVQDPHEKVEFLDAADFLALPGLDEVISNRTSRARVTAPRPTTTSPAPTLAPDR